MTDREASAGFAEESTPLHPEEYKPSTSRHPWSGKHKSKYLNKRQAQLKERPCRVHSKVVNSCKKCTGDDYLATKRRQTDESVTPRQLQQREYFRQWKQKTDRTDTVSVRCRPEDKTQILFACELAGISLTDFVVNSALEASKYLLNIRNKR